ncbi:MAG: cation:proton antiporter [Candidatus Melainabacteria bacterium]
MDGWSLLLDLLLLLIGSVTLGTLFARFGQSPLIGYLLAGICLQAFGHTGQLAGPQTQKQLHTLAELGISTLLFSIGLEFSWQHLKSLGRARLLAGFYQVFCTLVVVALIGRLTGISWTAALFVGAMVSLSSTACVLRVFLDKGEVDSPAGRNALAILLVQDLAVVPLGILLSVVASPVASLSGMTDTLVHIALMAALLGVALFLVTQVVGVWLLSTPTLTRNRELGVLFAAVLGLAAAWSAHQIGISPALGAFLAGMFLGSSPFAAQVRADVSSLRILLLTLFFVSAGMAADATWIITHWPWVLGGSLGLIVLKSLITGGVLRLQGQSLGVSAVTALSLAQVGEFAFVLGQMGVEEGSLDPWTYQLMISLTIVSLFVSPTLMQLAVPLGDRLNRLEGVLLPGDAGALQNPGSHPVIIIGFGPAGQLAAQPCQALAQRVLVMDLNQEARQRADRLGFDSMVGDATHPELLAHVITPATRLIVITVPAVLTNLAVLETARTLAPQAHIVIRSRNLIHTEAFRRAGADVVYDDETAIGEQLRNHLETQMVLKA